MVLVLSGCSAQSFREAADREVYGILAERSKQLFGRPEPLSIEPVAGALRERLLAETPAEPVVLTFARALEVAAENSREYRAQRESVYLAALGLTLERWRLGYIPSLTAVAELTGEQNQAATGSVGAGFTKVLGTGATIVGNLGMSVFRVLFTGDRFHSLPAVLSLSVTQPLLRGFGSDITEEPLTQAERNVIYALRAYERFRHELAVDVATRVYRILQQIDTVDNEKANYDNLVIVRERNEALAQAGRLSDVEVGQAQQNELSARDRWIDAQRAFAESTDSLKIFLGLPVSAPIEVDPRELRRLVDEGLVPVTIDEARAFAAATRHRLDYRTTQDRVADAERRTSVAADALRAGLDLGASYSVASLEGRVADLRTETAAWDVSIGLDLPVDRLPERNAYRSSLVALEAERRSASLATDNIRLEIRNLVRDLAQARSSFEIQSKAVDLARSRVESVELNLQAGRANTRDLLEAQESLVSAQNALTRNLIEYTLARLSLYRDLGALQVDESGLHIDAEVLAASLPEGSSPDAQPN